MGQHDRRYLGWMTSGAKWSLSHRDKVSWRETSTSSRGKCQEPCHRRTGRVRSGGAGQRRQRLRRGDSPLPCAAASARAVAQGAVNSAHSDGPRRKRCSAPSEELRSEERSLARHCNILQVSVGESTALMAAAGGEYLTSSCLYFVDISLSHTHTHTSVFPAAADARHDPIGR